MTTLAQFLGRLERAYPLAWAESWDNPGLQVGDPDAEVTRVMLALDPTDAVVDEAVAAGADLLLTHHPLLFDALGRIDATDPVGAIVTRAIRAQLAVVAAHTNADVADPGVSDALAARVGVRVTGVLQPTRAGDQVKLVAFVPEEATHGVLEALARAGAGALGEYDVCSFRVAGTGTFRPSERATPSKGKKRQVNEVAEDRLEMLVPRVLVDDAVEALRGAHPYEEPAFDLIGLERSDGWGTLGLGRVGEVDGDLRVGELVERCREGLGTSVRLVGDPDRVISRVALCGGSAASLHRRAAAVGAEVFITGDVKHHEALDARAEGLVVIDAGHAGTEWPWVEDQVARVSRWFPELEVALAEAPRDPFAGGAA